MIPQDLKFTKTHEWAKIDGDGVVTVGVSEFAVAQLGDIVFIELPAVGDSVSQEAAFATIESVKAAVEIYSPVSGEIVEINEPVADGFDLLDEDPYARAWLIKVKIADAGQLDALMSANDYEAYLQSPHCQH